MKPWFADPPPQAGDGRTRRGAEPDAQEYGPPASLYPSADLANRPTTQPSGTWPRRSAPMTQEAPPMTPGAPPGAPAGGSRPMAREAPPNPPPGREIARPILSLGRFGRATGFSLKLRFLLALTLLSLAPAFLLVLLYQQANQSSLAQEGQQALLVTAQNSSHALTQELLHRQQQLVSVAKQPDILQASQGATASVGNAEAILNEAALSTPDGVAWMVINGSDQIVASSPTAFEQQALGASAVLQQSAFLEAFVKLQRTAPAPKKGQMVLAVTSGEDEKISGKIWFAVVAFTSPNAPAQSGAVVAVFSLAGIVNSYLTPYSASSTSYAALLDEQGILLGVIGNPHLAQQLGQSLSAAPLQTAFQMTQTGQGSGGEPFIFSDPTTGTQEEAAGALIQPLGWVCLVVASPNDLAPPTTGLLSPQNLPLIILSIIVVTTLVATWVALPIVRPIRRATREILASTDDVRLLAEQARQIAKDQRLGTDILKGAAKGLDLRRQAIGRDAGLIANTLAGAANRLTQVAQIITVMPESYQERLQPLTREIYQELRTSHQLATGIANTLESDPVQKRLGNAMEGASEISQQFDKASQQLQQGAGRLERAAESLQ